MLVNHVSDANTGCRVHKFVPGPAARKHSDQLWKWAKDGRRPALKGESQLDSVGSQLY